MNKQNVFNISVILMMIAGFGTVAVLDNDGNELEPTHYCESREITMYCAKTTTQYCYPKLDTRLGSKKCEEGWKEIPQKIQTGMGIKYVCSPEGCK